MINVVVVEDSAVQRAHLVRTLEKDGEIKVVGEAEGAVEAVDLVTKLRPDVVTLDLQIPGGGGQVAIEDIMALAPTPILVLSATMGTRDSAVATRALEAGAVDLFAKPELWDEASEAALRDRVRILRGVTVIRFPNRRLRPRRRDAAAVSRSPEVPVVAIAASTGGPAALAGVLAGLGGVEAAVLVVQHLHPDFVGGLVSWMGRVSPLEVRLAQDGLTLTRGTVLIAPGETHLKVAPDGRVVLDPEPASLHRPSADELFSSLAEHRTRPRVGVVLTGMGDDGAAGLLALRRSGAVTIVQDQETSVVYGMPRAAERLGAASQVLPLEEIPRAILRAARP